jgi:hypothetical protein
MSGAGSRWIGGGSVGWGAGLGARCHSEPAPATITIPSRIPTETATARLKKPAMSCPRLEGGGQVKLLPSAASFASSGAGCQKAWSSAGFFANFFIAWTTFHSPTVSA